MLISYGHGKRILMHPKAYDSSRRYYEDCVASNEVLRYQEIREYATSDGGYPDAPTPPPNTVPPKDAFRYILSDTAEIKEIKGAAEKLDALADAMAETLIDQNDEDGESGMPPIMTYLGQFIDHDITANTDREENAATLDRFNIDKDELKPQNRADVEKFKGNLRKGNLGLDSVYGDGPGQADGVTKLEAALRDPDDPAKMRLGVVSPTPGFERPEFPADDGADLPRVGQVIDEGVLTMAEAREMFDDPSSPKSDRAIRLTPLIGDARNDENLIVAQTHLAFLRFHNAIVDQIRAEPNPPCNSEEVFDEARKQVTWTYQWLVTNVFLKAICDADMVDQVVAEKAPIYQDFFDAHRNEVPEGVRPMPLEFSVATFRYGHSMIRGEYDYNRNFGRKTDGTENPIFGRATFEQIFQFTSGGGMIGNLENLPDNWIIEWDRFTGVTPASNRVARKIDTKIALPLKAMRNNGPGMTGIMNHLASRNLRRGYLFNLPDAQTLHAGLEAAGADLGSKLTKTQLKSGHTKDAVEDGDFDASTPLWFYLLKEAEVKADGEHLGPLGSRIVAETIVGLMVTDPSSYLFAGDAGFNSWTPDDAVKPFGQPVNTLPALLRAAGVMGAGSTS